MERGNAHLRCGGVKRLGAVLLILALCAAPMLSCGRQPARTVQVEQADEEILLIAEDARKTLYIFFRHLGSSGGGGDGFFIKYPFRADGGSGVAMEQLWLTNIRFRNGAYSGVLVSSPMYVRGMKKGNTVAFEIDAVTDWMFVQDGKISGGRSIKYLLEKIPENQRNVRQQKLLQMFDN